jgi:hypothetical protein
MFRGHVVLFGKVVFQIVQPDGLVGAARSVPFPTALVQGGLPETAFVELPVQEFVLGCRSVWPNSVGTKLSESSSEGSSAPANSTAVANQSPK